MEAVPYLHACCNKHRHIAFREEKNCEVAPARMGCENSKGFSSWGCKLSEGNRTTPGHCRAGTFNCSTLLSATSS